MNERLVFPVSVFAAEFGASALFYLLLRESPVMRRYPEAYMYMEAHAIPSLCVWVLLTALVAAVMPTLWRRRQNRSSKLALLARIGAVGLAIDAIGTLYLWFWGEDEGISDSGWTVSLLLMRLGIYAVVFAVVVGTADQMSAWHSRRNPPSATPPPRFGRV